MYFRLKNCCTNIMCVHFYNFVSRQFWDARNSYILRDPCASEVLCDLTRRCDKN